MTFFSILRNIDPFAAGVSETPLADGQLGPLYSCVVGFQFAKLKLGDRFYYTHPGARFTKGKEDKKQVVVSEI